MKKIVLLHRTLMSVLSVLVMAKEPIKKHLTREVIQMWRPTYYLTLENGKVDPYGNKV